MRSSEPTFRPDIEGVRGLAVLLVVYFHYSNGSGAGFVGVDLFFVISGFLITQLIVHDLRHDRFSFVNFYARRARRILPALLFMVLITFVFSLALLSPNALVLFSQQATFTVFGTSNVFFWFNTGYFSPEAHRQILLHTWSLGVEEQFYLLWPFALALIFKRFGFSYRTFLTGIGGLIVASFVFMLLIKKFDSAFAFFMLPARAWQLAIGGFLALAPCTSHKMTGEITRLAGLVLIATSVLTIDADMGYPNLSALLPTIGAAFLIWPIDRNTIVSKAVSAPSLRYFGRISYSLYLWHWPLLVLFLAWDMDQTVTRSEGALLFLLALGAAHISWRFVEQPFRRGECPAYRTLISYFSFTAVCALALFSAALAQGFPSRFNPEGQVLSQKMQREYLRPEPAYCDFRAMTHDSSSCGLQDSTDRHVLVMGDSHAMHFITAFQEAFPEVRFSTLHSFGCRPVLNSVGDPNCVEMYERFFGDTLLSVHFDAIIVSARWRNGEYQNIGETADLLLDHTDRLIVLGQTVEYEYSLPEILFASHLPRREAEVSRFLSNWSGLKFLDQKMKEDLSKRGVEYYSVIKAVCPSGDCTVFTPSGMPISWDYGHFNLSGARLVLERLQTEGLSLP